MRWNCLVTVTASASTRFFCKYSRMNCGSCTVAQLLPSTHTMIYRWLSVELLGDGAWPFTKYMNAQLNILVFQFITHFNAFYLLVEWGVKTINCGLLIRLGCWACVAFSPNESEWRRNLPWQYILRNNFFYFSQFSSRPLLYTCIKRLGCGAHEIDSVRRVELKWLQLGDN